MRNLALAMSLSLAALAYGAHAQPGAAVTVAIGANLQSKTADFGQREVNDLRDELRDRVSHALARGGAAPVRVDLVIEDAAPNRPTFEELGRTQGLSLRSVGVGGARISGVATFANGGTRPIRFQWYETDIRDEAGATTWTDAERSFDFLASDLAHGKVPDAYRGAGPSSDDHRGHFGNPVGY